MIVTGFQQRATYFCLICICSILGNSEKFQHMAENQLIIQTARIGGKRNVVDILHIYFYFAAMYVKKIKHWPQNYLVIQFYHIICSIQMERFYNSKWGGYMVTLTQKCRQQGCKKTSFDAPYHFMRITVISRRRNNINNLIRISLCRGFVV